MLVSVSAWIVIHNTDNSRASGLLCLTPGPLQVPGAKTGVPWVWGMGEKGGAIKAGEVTHGAALCPHVWISPKGFLIGAFLHSYPSAQGSQPRQREREEGRISSFHLSPLLMHIPASWMFLGLFKA